jgi:tetratricopeptide (TPR) repeat protein
MTQACHFSRQTSKISTIGDLNSSIQGFMATPPPATTQQQRRAAYAEALFNLRSGRAATAERQLRSLQAGAPGEPNSLRLLGVALLDQDKAAAALECLEQVASTTPDFWAARVDLARALRVAGRLGESREQLRAVVAAAPGLGGAWLAYGDLLVDLELYPDAVIAFERARLADSRCAGIERARTALTAGDRKRAEAIFREVLQEDPGHVSALCGLAAVSLVASRGADALRLLLHAQRQSQHLPLITRGLCQTFTDLGRLPEAEAAAHRLLKIEPENPQNWVNLGNVCIRLMRQADALVAFEQAARINPAAVRLRLSIGHLHKTLGRRAESEIAYRACLALDPAFAEAYSSLADLKNYAFDEADVTAMRSLLKGEEGDDADQSQLHFALGRAYEQRQAYTPAFEHYARGNARRRKIVPFDIRAFEDKTRRVLETFDAQFFSARAGRGCPDGAPIFVVGLPRSGSTLIEQILASHSSVEGTFELPNVLTIVRDFDHADRGHDAYPEVVDAAPLELFASLGERYMAQTAPLRSGKPHFIDKMPNNFSHVGLIHAMLPRAIIIDARRHPLDCCFSTFKQYFAEGQSFSYDLSDLGRYYRCYLALMDHWNRVLPGRVLHLQYEELVRDPEHQIRMLLTQCGLPFEAACLSFHETQRPVRTASSEQVRQPLYTSGVGYWRRFASHLEPLRAALGDSVARFPEYDRLNPQLND